MIQHGRDLVGRNGDGKVTGAPLRFDSRGGQQRLSRRGDDWHVHDPDAAQQEAMAANARKDPAAEPEPSNSKVAASQQRTAKGTTKGSTRDPGTIKTLADATCADNHFAKDAGGRLYHFAGGAYRRNGDDLVRRRCKALLEKWEETREWSSRLGKEVAEYIRVDAPELWDRPPADMLNVKNGLLRLADRKLLPHSPEHLSLVQLPVEFVPHATCPNNERFVVECFPTDAHDLAWEIIAHAMVPSGLQKAVLLLGEGANGKSAYLNVVTKFLGSGNCAALSLHRLESDRFAAARLIGMLANICPDLPSEHLAGTSVFKAIVAGDTMPAERKFCDSFEFVPFCKLIFSANHPPRSADGSHAFFRRWVAVPFDRTFEAHEQIPRKVLDARLTTPEELSGLLNKAIAAYHAMRERGGFSEPPSIVAALDEFRSITDPLAVWLDRNTIDGPDLLCTKSELRSAYNDDAADEGKPTLGAKAFGQALRRVRPYIKDAQRTIGGRLQWCYVGLEMREKAR